MEMLQCAKQLGNIEAATSLIKSTLLLEMMENFAPIDWHTSELPRTRGVMNPVDSLNGITRYNLSAV